MHLGDIIYIILKNFIVLLLPSKYSPFCGGITGTISAPIKTAPQKAYIKVNRNVECYYFNSGNYFIVNLFLKIWKKIYTNVVYFFKIFL